MARRKKQTYPLWAVAAAVLLSMLAGVFLHGGNGTQPAQSAQDAISQPASAVQNDTLVYFLDVGQGDSELIRLKTGQNVLIDTGTGETKDKLANYLHELGVQRIDILIATHPHEDHIGGMQRVVEEFPVGQIYMPKIPDAQVPTTSVYEKLLTAIDKKNLKITAPKGGESILSSGDMKLEVFAPNASKYSDLNSYSIVTKLTCGEKSFLFTGDAQSDSEKEMLAKGYDLKSDVLKCGHHGSSTSTSAAFLKAVNPGAAVISCGVDNDYGHPDAAVVNRLEKAGITIYRTDRQDTVLARCDGKTITFSTGLKSIIK